MATRESIIMNALKRSVRFENENMFTQCYITECRALQRLGIEVSDLIKKFNVIHRQHLKIGHMRWDLNEERKAVWEEACDRAYNNLSRQEYNLMFLTGRTDAYNALYR